jgi:uncharacterized protein (TIGR03000 family)
MYSVVLMMAITTGGEAPDCHRHQCHSGGGLLAHHHSHGSCGCASAPSCGSYAAPVNCGCYGAPVSYGCYGGTPYVAPPKKEELKKLPGDKKDEKKDGDKPIGGLVAPGTIVVSMPADARFTIDDYTSPAQSDKHIVVSAPLGAEETRTYVLKAEVVRDGKVQKMEQTVTVRAGEEAKVTLSLAASVAAK